MLQPAPHRPTPPYAGFGSRFYAYLIDQSIIQGAALALVAPFSMKTINGVIDAYSAALSMSSVSENALDEMQNNLTDLVGVMLIFGLVQFVIGVLYGALFESSAGGATLGKRYCNLRVTDDEGNQLGFMTALLRNVGVSVFGSVANIDLIVALFVLPAYLTPLITAKRQTLYDMVMKTVVIRTE